MEPTRARNNALDADYFVSIFLWFSCLLHSMYNEFFKLPIFNYLFIRGIIMLLKSGSLNVCSFQVVIRLHSTSPSWAPAMWQSWWQGDMTWILSPGCLWSHRTRTHIRTNVLTRLWLVLQWKANSAVGTGEGERISPGRYGKVLEGRWTLSRSL